jgi:hypothetical protein
MVQSREWMKKDHTIIVAVGVMYTLLLIALFFGQGKKRVHDKYFADGVRCERWIRSDCSSELNVSTTHGIFIVLSVLCSKARLFYDDAAACVSSLDEVSAATLAIYLYILRFCSIDGAIGSAPNQLCG